MPWTTNVKIPNQKSKRPPALAEFGGRLHMVHLGDSSNDIWHSTFNGTSWTANVKIPKQKSKASPALAAFGGRLQMVHLGDSSNDIWQSNFNGTSWTPNVKIPNQQSKAPPALAEFGGRLHMVHLGDSSNDIWHSNFNGTSWTPNVKIPNQQSKAPPALAAFGGRLHMVHLGNTSNDIWYSTFNGTSWTANVKIPDQKSKAAPALATFTDVCGRETLAMVHLGDSSNKIWYSQLAGSVWTRNYYVIGQLSKSSPGLTAITHVGGSQEFQKQLGDLDRVLLLHLVAWPACVGSPRVSDRYHRSLRPDGTSIDRPGHAPSPHRRKVTRRAALSFARPLQRHQLSESPPPTVICENAEILPARA
jgi:hypothetical protein